MLLTSRSHAAKGIVVLSDDSDAADGQQQQRQQRCAGRSPAHRGRGWNSRVQHAKAYAALSSVFGSQLKHAEDELMSVWGIVSHTSFDAVTTAMHFPHRENGTKRDRELSAAGLNSARSHALVR